MSATTLAEVARILRIVVGEDWEVTVPIEMTTSFARDLELESLEFVELAELLQERYGADVDFVGWLSGKELEAILALTVGDVVDFIDACRAS